MKTNIKMRVTPEQSKKVQEILGLYPIYLDRPFLIINKAGLSKNNIVSLHGIEEDRYYKLHKFKEVDADLFIKTNGTCKYKNDFKNLDNFSEDNGDNGINAASNTAEEMFKELGYTQVIKDNSIVYTDYTYDEIIFNISGFNEKIMELDGIERVSIRLYNAIHQQMKELGWIK